MIHLVSLAFGPFPAVEPFNRSFRPGHPKMRLTVDAETTPRLADASVYRALLDAFPAIGSHACQADPQAATRGRGVALVRGDSAANQAHLLEHLVLEMSSSLDGIRRLSGVTCAYESPRERSDVFVECDRLESGSLVALMALDAMNAALEGEPLAPRYPDMLLCARELRAPRAGEWLAAGLARATGLTPGRAEAALEALSRVRVVQEVPYAMNFSGEPVYRFVGVAGATG